MIAAILTRLRTLPQLKLVAGALEWAALDAPPPQHLWPACYVTPWSTGATPNGIAAGGFRQELAETAAIHLVAGNLRDPRGEAATADLTAIRDAVRTHLLGWVPATGWEQLELTSGRLFAVVDGVAVWQDLVASRQQFFKT
jgi:hypothetical protein